MPEGFEETKSFSMRGGLIIGGLVAVALIAFITQNTNEVPITWLFVERTAPLWLVIVVSAVLGALLSEVIAWLIRRRRRSDGPA